MRFGLILGALACVAPGEPARAAPPPVDLALWRLDCGTVQVPDADFLNDAFAFSGVAKTVSVSCYLRRAGPHARPPCPCSRGVPKINTSRADTLALMDRIKKIAANLHAKVIIGHEPSDIAKLAAFPEAQR